MVRPPGSSSSSRRGPSLLNLLLLVTCCSLSFYAGSLQAAHACVGSGLLSTASSSSQSTKGGLRPGILGINEAASEAEVRRIEDAVRERISFELAKAGKCPPGIDPEVANGLKAAPAAPAISAAAAGDGTAPPEYFPQTAKGIGHGMVRAPKSEFVDLYDFGNPYDASDGKGRNSDVLIVYARENAMPDDAAIRGNGTYEDGSGVPRIGAADATKNCDMMNVVLMDNPSGHPQCLALVNNYLSYHVQRWMRVGERGAVDSNLPLRAVSRGYNANGIRSYKSPSENDIRGHWDMLRTYLNSLDSVLEELKPIAERVARDNTVIVMTCNFGQSELLMNFVCAAESRGFDLGNVLVFSTDKETKELAEGLGLATYYDERNFEHIPTKEAGRYGDRAFVAMMYAKVVCVQLINMLGYDLLFQDVDVVWYQNPLPWFKADIQKKELEGKNGGNGGVVGNAGHPWDMYFQDDGAHTVRYAPYSANSGFYYVRSNERTRYLFASLLYHGDLIRTTDSHQQTLIALLNEHASLFGLRVKILNRDTPEFPGGWHYHKKNKQFMKSILTGEVTPYIFHMSWTTNKNNKLKFFQQMGEWRVKDTCVGKKAEEIGGGEGEAALRGACCSKEALVQCHFRDKPSIKPCTDSPPIDKNGKSFW